MQLLEKKKRIRARNRLFDAKERGLVTVGNTCLICGAKPGPNISRDHFIQHHEDYNKPLETITLCLSCHFKLHHRLKKQREQ